MIKQIEFLLSMGINISFKRELNMFEIILEREITEQIERVTLPFDHLNESKIMIYINSMKDEFLK